jgi:hypothetical protein
VVYVFAYVIKGNDAVVIADTSTDLLRVAAPCLVIVLLLLSLLLEYDQIPVCVKH